MHVIFSDEFSTSEDINRQQQLCNSITKEVYPYLNSLLYFFDDKNTKLASCVRNTGVGDFEKS